MQKSGKLFINVKSTTLNGYLLLYGIFDWVGFYNKQLEVFNVSQRWIVKITIDKPWDYNLDKFELSCPLLYYSSLTHWLNDETSL